MNKKQRREAEKAKKVATAAVSTAVQGAVDEVGVTKPIPEPKEPKVKKVLKSGMPAMPKLPKLGRSAKKDKPTQPCTCGCGGQTKGMWVPGHDARAKGYALRIERGIMKMADVPANEQPGAKHYLRLRKELGTTAKITLVKDKSKAKVEPVSEPVTETEPASEPAVGE